METDGRLRPLTRYAVTASLYVAAYVLLDWVSYVHPLARFAVDPWNPPPGLSLFLLLRFGLRYVPALYVAAFAADAIVRGVAPSPGLALASPLLLATGYAAVGALLAGPLRVDPAFNRLRDVNRLVAAAGVGPLLIGPAYVGLHLVLGNASRADVVPAVTQFWIGDAIGIVVTTPLLLAFARPGAVARGRLGVETALQAAAVLAALWLVFGVKATDEFKFFYVLFLPLIWIAMRHGIRGSVVASLAIQLGIIAAASGLAVKGVPLREVQFLMLALALTALYLGVAVTEREDARRGIAARDRALNRSQRMAAAGELAAAVAHEVNQPLAAIRNYVRACALMAEQRHADPQLRATLEKAGREVTRASAVVQRLRDFYRTGSARRERVAPRALVDGAIEALAPRLAEHRIAVGVEAAAGLPPVEVDPAQLRTVLDNLLGNAVDALAATAGGVRRIRVAAAAVSPSALAIDIADTGPGLPADVAARIFEPFNSTKPDGMGLGLALCHSIVAAHGGRLTLDPDAGSGTSFRLVLPFAADDPRHHR